MVEAMLFLVTKWLRSTVLLSTIAVGACAAASGDQAACERALSPAYPELEAVAHEVMAGVTGEWQRRATCDPHGRPIAEARLHVYEWSDRREAKRHLIDAGVRFVDSEIFTPDGDYSVWYMGVTDYLVNDGRKFVEVIFTDRSPVSSGVVDCSDCSD